MSGTGRPSAWPAPWARGRWQSPLRSGDLPSSASSPERALARIAAAGPAKLFRGALSGHELLRGPYRRDLDEDPDLVTEEEAAGLERHLPPEAEVLAVDRAARTDAHAV